MTFEAPASGTDLSAQLSMFNNAITTHVDGIVLAAQQPQPLSGPVGKAIKAGVPVVTVDSGVSPATSDSFIATSDSFIATSNIKAAAAVCAYGAKLAGSRGEYGIIDLGEVPLIKNGTIKGSLLQSPYTMGYQAVQELVAIKAGKSVPKRVDTKTCAVTPQNVSTAAAKQYLAQYGAAKGVKP